MSVTRYCLRLGVTRWSLGPGEHLIGRDPEGTISLDDPRASWAHARILVEPDGGAQVEDLQSTNGTLLNGVPLATRVRQLELGDTLTIGSQELRVEGSGHARGTTDGYAPVSTAAVASSTRGLERVALLAPADPFTRSLYGAFQASGLRFTSGATARAVLSALGRVPDHVLFDERLVAGTAHLSIWQNELRGARFGLVGKWDAVLGEKRMRALGLEFYLQRPASAILFVARLRLAVTRLSGINVTTTLPSTPALQSATVPRRADAKNPRDD